MRRLPVNPTKLMQGTPIHFRSVLRWSCVFVSVLQDVGVVLEFCCGLIALSAQEEPCEEYDEREGRDASYHAAGYGADGGGGRL
jgi:hypothetical protein